jgi:hypothetical protein
MWNLDFFKKRKEKRRRGVIGGEELRDEGRGQENVMGI